MPLGVGLVAWRREARGGARLTPAGGCPRKHQPHAPPPLTPPPPQRQGNKKLEMGLKAGSRLLLREAVTLYGKGLELCAGCAATDTALLNNRAHVHALLGAAAGRGQPGERRVLAATCSWRAARQPDRPPL